MQAEWKEKAGKLKPTALQREKLDTNLRVEAPEFVPGFKGGGLWSSDRLLEVRFYFSNVFIQMCSSLWRIVNNSNLHFILLVCNLCKKYQ